jgi:hypothetical protein
MKKSRRKLGAIQASNAGLLDVYVKDGLVYDVLGKKGLKTSKIARRILDSKLLASIERKPQKIILF